jgi:hypothetical protein
LILIINVIKVCHNLLDTPVSAAAFNNDSAMIMWLMDNGAFLDYRMEKDHWKTPLHIAAMHNKPLALKVHYKLTRRCCSLVHG